MTKRICSKCQKEKDVDNFPFKNTSKGIRHSACGECWVEIRRLSYNKNKIATVNRNKRNKDKNKDWFDELKTTLKCAKCSENHPACLDFHHLDGADKDLNVSDMARSTYNQKAVEVEIAKCVVLCSNCHRKLHHEEKQKPLCSLTH